MAHIIEARPGTFRVQIDRKGFRKSGTFPTRAEAEQWAAKQEERILKRVDGMERRAQTVLLSNIPRRVLQAIEACPFKADEVLEAPIPLPQVSGIYFLIRDGEVKYVGKSSNVLRRISYHVENGYRFDSYNVVFCDAERLADLEQTYITAMVPPWNQHMGGPGEGISIPSRKLPKAERAEPVL